MKQVFPQNRDVAFETIREAISSSPVTTAAPFSDAAIALCEAISRKLFALPNAQEMSEVYSLAFFLREGSLRKLKQEWLASVPGNCNAMPRGRVFHIAPANVEVMFVYSWVISMLCGNANIVRIPSKPSRIIDILCESMSEVLKDFPEIAATQFGVSYEADNVITKALSEISQVRIIWGGDETVKSIRSVEAPAGLRDVVFPNRFSWAAVKADSLLQMSEEQRGELATRFFNDSYLFDQRACSSPQIFVFVGADAESAKAHALFMGDLQKIVEARKYTTDASHAIEKLSAAALIAARDFGAVLDNRSPELMNIAATYSEHVRTATCGGGFFVVLYLPTLDAIASMATARDQTLSHAGFTESELSTALTEIRGRGFDRIVPFGQALQFEPIWDGMNLMNELTRIVRCLW
jgi:hypothetical protein